MHSPQSIPLRCYIQLFFSTLIILLFSACSSSGKDPVIDPPETDIAALKVQLGEVIFNDTNLSEPAGQSCATCHEATAAFTDPNSSNLLPISEGVVAGRFGNRNAPTASYASFIPEFSFDSTNNEYVGGQFLDGRAADLTEQAKAPFLNEVEMANTDEEMVIQKIRAAGYADLFRQVYGESSLNDTQSAFNNMADAIAAFESTDLFSPFSSKFDAVLAGTAELSAQETRGLDLFQNKALCTECHTIPEGVQPLFTNFTYSNIGTPANPNNPVYEIDSDFIDLGLAQNTSLTTDISLEQGKFRVPTLRNVEITAPYMHNGVLQTLEQVVNFYNTRDSNQCFGANAEPLVNCWPEPEVNINVDISSMGDLLLSEQEEADLVAFLKTLTDGF